MSSEFNAALVQAWEALSGKDMSSMSLNLGGDGIKLYDANKRIKEALSIGDEITVSLIIKQVSQAYADSYTVTCSLSDILAGKQHVSSKLEALIHLRALLDQPSLTASHEAFYSHCLQAIAHYRDKDVSELSEDDAFVRQSGGFVGLDALSAMNQLTRLTLCDGQLGDDDGLKVSRLIFAFDSIEELLSHAQRIPSGFSLCCIMSESISDSYFALIVRNGQRIVILTDKGNYEHPLQESRMRARNSRYNESRTGASKFPYDILDIEWLDNGRKARRSDASKGTELMVSDTGFRVLSSLDKLSSWDLLWLHLFIEQCRDRYFKEQHLEPMLATGSMLCLTHPWKDVQAALPVPMEFALPCPVRKSSELTTDFMRSIEPGWDKKYNANVWMEKRFGHLVPDEALYIPAGSIGSETPLIESKGGGLVKLSRQDLTGESCYVVEKKPVVALTELNLTALADRERVVRDAHFLARHNQAAVIAHLVQMDFVSRKEELVKWWYASVKKNLPNILDDLLTFNNQRFQILDRAQGELPAALLQAGVEHIQTSTGVVSVIGTYRRIMIKHYPVRNQYQNLMHPRTEKKLPHALGLVNLQDGEYRCCLSSNTPAQLLIRLEVKSVIDIMNICGLSFAKVPPELQHLGLRIYSGNSILNRIDPLLGIQNPWDKVNLDFTVPVSFQQLKIRRKALGLDTPKIGELESFVEKLPV